MEQIFEGCEHVKPGTGVPIHMKPYQEYNAGKM